ncbi:hypothetical protein [Clostridium sp. HBUAS56010]|uniref:hypothetical protein n=1 Tax=Clostridium sp. HBUAS56010 TaxID=2571127 RepID=UPI001177766C|nr:hypothetical protein [Clostridium sp. HBUAS56010]
MRKLEEDILKHGDIVELIEDMTFYKKGRKAMYLRSELHNDKNAEIAWLGEKNDCGDVEIVPKRILKISN